MAVEVTTESWLMSSRSADIISETPSGMVPTISELVEFVHLWKPQPLKSSRLPPTTIARMHVISGAEGRSQPKRFLSFTERRRENHSMNHQASPSSSCSHCVFGSPSTTWPTVS